MAKTYAVQAGDTIVSIAFKEGFRTWETIWNHPQNEALRDTRSDPAALYVGDELFIPDKTQKSVSIKTFDSSSNQNQKYTFQVKSLKIYLSLVLEDENGEPYRNKKYQIRGNNQSSPIKGQTDAAGFFNAAMPPDTTAAELTLWKSDTDETQTAIWQFNLGAASAPDENITDNTISDTTGNNNNTTTPKSKPRSKS